MILSRQTNQKRWLYIYLQNKTKIQRFWKVRQRENHARSLGFFAFITANMAVISNTVVTVFY